MTARLHGALVRGTEAPLRMLMNNLDFAHLGGDYRSRPPLVDARSLGLGDALARRCAPTSSRKPRELKAGLLRQKPKALATLRLPRQDACSRA
jgi:hypothetical protein